MRRSRLPAGVPAGVLATITMDAAMVAAGRLGIGLWAPYLARRRPRS